MENYHTNRQTSWGSLSDEDVMQLSSTLGEIRLLLDHEHSLFYWILAGIAATVACICVGLVVGEFWFIVILVILFWPSLTAYGTKNKDRERIDRIAQLMSICLTIISQPPEHRVFIDDGARVRGIELYNAFIKVFPSYQSGKLRYAMKR